MSRIDRLNKRRIDELVSEAKLVNESYREIEQSDSVKYVIGSMQPIDPDYTRNTIIQAERVKTQLENRLEDYCEYEYQGSVTNDTHIKAKSDIDLLVLIDKFFTLEKPQVPKSPYKGNPVQDLLDLRQQAETSLKDAFPKACVDSSGSKSITIEGGSLTRKVDVVPSNWFNTNKYAETGNKIYRGIQVLDASVPCRVKNTPFLHNAWIEHRDQETNGGLRKACRLMKSLKYDTDNIELSSYDIVSIAFNIPIQHLNYPKGSELTILANCLSFCSMLREDKPLRESIYVPDNHRKVFANGHATMDGLGQLIGELEDLRNDVLNENQRSFSRLAEARVDY